MILDSFKIENPKTKEVIKILLNLKAVSKENKKNRVLLLLDKIDNNLKLALRNISFLNVDLAKDAHAYEIMACKKLIITKDGLKDLMDRLN